MEKLYISKTQFVSAGVLRITLTVSLQHRSLDKYTMTMRNGVIVFFQSNDGAVWKPKAPHSPSKIETR